MEPRSLAGWLDLLGHQHKSLLDDFKTYDDTLCAFATRLWCVKESIFKATGAFPQTIAIERTSQQGVIFTSQVSDNLFHVLTFPVTIWHKNVVVVGAIIKVKSNKVQESLLHLTFSKTATGGKSIPRDISISSLQSLGVESETGKLVYSFYSTFRDCRSFFSKTYFTNYLSWIGILREIGLLNISDSIVRDLESGNFGLVTNESSIKIYNEADTLTNIIGKVWTTETTDFSQSFIDTRFELID